MKFQWMILSLFLVFSVAGLVERDPVLGMIRTNSPVKSGELFEMHVNVVNDLEDDLDDMHLRLFFPELGEYFQVNTFDIDDNDKQGKWFTWALDIPPGEYLTRITVSNDDFRSVKYRYITVI